MESSLSIEEFKQLLNAADLDYKSFSEITGTSNSTIYGWCTKGSKKKIPGWVKPFLECYPKAKLWDSMILAAVKKELEKCKADS